jgi:hypothetical protein
MGVMTTTRYIARCKVHIFEMAGLGLAPFHFVGYERKVFVACPGAPVQVGGSCDYCSTGISNMFWVKSADGKRFKVGSECILKAGDKGLKRAVNAIKLKETHAKQDATIARGTALLADLGAKLALRPHSEPYWAAQGQTALDQMTRRWNYSGRAGRIRITKELERLAKEEAR